MRIHATLLALLLLSAPRLAAATLAIDIPPDLRPAWERLLAASPLPAGTTVESGAAIGTSDGRLAMVVGSPAEARVVDRILVSPVASLSDPRTGMTLAEARSGKTRLVAFESVTLPDRALPVDGFFPDAHGYPLSEEVSVTLSTRDQALRGWYSSLPVPPPAPRPVQITWIGAVGDIMPARGVDGQLLSADGLRRVFGDTLPSLSANAILLGNLESAATTRGAKAVKTYTFRFAPSALGPLATAGFSYLSIANNHTFDFGPQGFLDTLAALGSAGIATSGAGTDTASAVVPFTDAGHGVRILSFGAYPVDRTGFDGRKTAKAGTGKPGTLWLDADGLAAARAAFVPGAFSIALVHGGQEWQPQPTAEEKDLYRQLVDAGANLVIGSHPHVLQGMEARGGGLIAYSLGNFLFPGMDGTPGGQDSVILRVGVSGGAIRIVQEVPVHLEGGTVRLAADDKSIRVLAALSARLAAGT